MGQFPPDMTRDLDEHWAKRYVSNNNDMDQFKMTWNCMHWVTSEGSWYDGLPLSPWENVEGIVADKYANLLMDQKEVTLEVRIDTVMRLNQAVHFYLVCYMNGVQEESLTEHLSSFKYDQVYKKNFVVPSKK